jgi:6-pyruvoyltetrahydropterin/6-carboxytetrahydropterin synthase
MPAQGPRAKRRAVRRAPPGKTVSRALSGTVYITRQVHFNAAHRLMNPFKDQKWNEQKFGPCNNPHWHGHNYVLEVTVKGQPDPETGYVLDLAALKRVLHEAVVDKCDHRNLNTDVDFLAAINPSTENLVIAFWREIAPRLPSGELHCVRLYETPRNFADYYGPDAD